MPDSGWWLLEGSPARQGVATGASGDSFQRRREHDGVGDRGRDEERASVAAFVAQVPDSPSALVLEGEAGIGKSTLWLEGVGLARARGLRVLASRPAEAERALAHVGLGDLLEEVLDEALPSSAAPRRGAGVAMLRDTGQALPWTTEPSPSRSATCSSSWARTNRFWSR